MKAFYVFLAMFAGNFLFSQITFKGCIPLFEDQFFTLNNTGTDSFGKKIYITTPVTGDQPCGGLGTCEFKIQWNNGAGRWDFLADSGNGDFVSPYLIYYSTAGNSGATNPPNITIGNWVENTAVTSGACGGNLTNANASMTGDVHSSVLAVNDANQAAISLYPNPAVDYISLRGVAADSTVRIFAADGKLISKANYSEKIDVSKLSPGLYVVEISSGTKVATMKFIKK